MKYRIVYPTGYTDSACYLIGYEANGCPIYRYYTTRNTRSSYNKLMAASVMAALAAGVSLAENEL